MEIRLAVAEDLVEICRYDSHIPVNRLEKCIESGFQWVLCDGEKLVGVLRFSLFWQTMPFLDLIYIDEAYRGCGWGSRMMIRWEENMKELGYAHCMLSTQEDETAKVFYEKLGYRRIGAFLPPEQEADEIMYLKTLKD